VCLGCLRAYVCNLNSITTWSDFRIGDLISMQDIMFLLLVSRRSNKEGQLPLRNLVGSVMSCSSVELSSKLVKWEAELLPDNGSFTGQ
jgi:hypothetical protein